MARVDFSREAWASRHLIYVHRGLRITDEQRQRFVDLYAAALDAAGMPAPLRLAGAATEHIGSGPRSPSRTRTPRPTTLLHPSREVPL